MSSFPAVFQNIPPHIHRQQQQQQPIVTSPTERQHYPPRPQHAPSLATTSLEPSPVHRHATTPPQQYHINQTRPTTQPSQFWSSSSRQQPIYGGGSGPAQSYRTNLSTNTPISYPALHPIPTRASPPSTGFPETFGYSTAERNASRSSSTGSNIPSSYVPAAVPGPVTSAGARRPGEYQPPTQSALPYEERHKISDHLLKRFEQKQLYSGVPGASAAFDAAPKPVRTSPPAMSQTQSQGWSPTPCVQPSFANTNTYASPPSSSIQQLGSHYHATPTPPSSSSITYQPNQAVKQEGAGASSTRNVMFAIPATTINDNCNASPIANLLAHGRTAPPPPRPVPVLGTPIQRVVKSSPSTPLFDQRSRSATRPAAKAKSTTPPTGTFVQYSPYQRDRDSKGPMHRVDTTRLAPQPVPQPIALPANNFPAPVVHHQTIALTDITEDTADRLEGVTKKGKKDSKPFLACEFCRLRKIACGPGPTLPPGIEVPPGPRTCNQCHRRGHVCRFPEASRRGLRHGKPSRLVVYGPDNQFKIVDPEGIDDGSSLQWDDVQDVETQRPGATITMKGPVKGSGGKTPSKAELNGPIQFVDAVDTEILRDLVARGIIPPGDAAGSPK